MNKQVRFLPVFLLLPFLVSAQETMYHPHSTKKVREADVLYKKKVVRALDLREPQNKPLFSKNREVTRILIDAIKSGELRAYTNDSLNRRLTKEEVTSRLVIPGSDDTTTLTGGWPGDWPPDPNMDPPADQGPDYYFYNQLYQLELTEDLIFDKQRSVMYHDILSITIYIPGDVPDNIRGIQEHVATVSYKDCLDFFRASPGMKTFNPKNDREHLNLADFFELWLFSSYIVKVSNPDDYYIADQYATQREGIIASKKQEFEFMEFEHNLWEY